MSPLLISILLLLLGIAFICLEFFIPSAGVLSFLAAGAFLLAVVVGFSGGLKLGTSILAASAIIIPVLFAVAVKYWPQTTLGRLLLSRPPTEDEVLPNDEHYQNLKTLVGRRGIAKSKMLPSGSVKIDGRTYDAVSQGMPIDAGQTVQVIAIRTNRIVIRLVEENELVRLEPDDEPRSAGAKETADELLSRPVDALGIEPLDDPLA